MFMKERVEYTSFNKEFRHMQQLPFDMGWPM